MNYGPPGLGGPGGGMQFQNQLGRQMGPGVQVSTFCEPLDKHTGQKPHSCP